jgi:GGDEF domain-containing protein
VYVRSSALRFWGIALAAAVGLAAFGLAAADPSATRWVGGCLLLVLTIAGAGQPVRMIGIPLAFVFVGLYAASVSALGTVNVTPAFVGIASVLALMVGVAADMFGRVCTAEDERQLARTQAVEELTPTDPATGVMKWQHAAPLFEREISRATRLSQELSFLLVRIVGGEDLDRRLGPEGAARALGEVGELLLLVCRSTDVVMYRGLGQFGVVLPDTSAELADVVAQRVLESAGAIGSVALVVGIATFPNDGQDPSDLMRVAGGDRSETDTTNTADADDARHHLPSTSEANQ